MRGLIQILVVGLVVLLGGGLFMAAVAKVREAAARIACQGRLRQIGMTLHYFDDGRRHFPPATVPNSDLAPEKRFSWLAAIGPLMESTDIYVNRDWNAAWDAPPNEDLATIWHKTYQCPNGPPLPPEGEYVPAQYLGISGLGTDAASLPLKHPRAGFFGHERKLTKKDIEDRQATLIVVIETTRIQGAWTAGGHATVRGLDRDDPPYFGHGAQFGGLHGNLTNVLFSDGSVRALHSSIDPKILEAMATLSGSALVSPDDF